MKTGRVKFKYILSSLRLNSDFHLAEGVVFDRNFRLRKHNLLGELTADIFCAGRSKRIYVDKQYGIPYLGNTDIISSSPLSGCSYVSEKFWTEKRGFLREGMILTGRVGQNTVGTYNYASKDMENCIGSDNVIRIISNEKVKNGFLYAFLASKYGFHLSRRHISGNAQPFITEDMLSDLPVPCFAESKQKEIHKLVIEAADLRVQANKLLNDVQFLLKKEAHLEDLGTYDYEYFGNNNVGRPVSTFVRSLREMTSISINAFNYSKRIEKLERRVRSRDFLVLSACLDTDQFFSSGSFKRLELKSPSSIKLINQSDIFNFKKQGKLIARKFVKEDRLVEYGEVIIAGVGTLGEGETFCRVVFANEELQGQLISGEFLRMKTNGRIPPGYLFCWLSTDYGFRLIRKTQSGTKLCRPIQDLLKNIPVPILAQEKMEEIDSTVKMAHTLMYKAICKEKQAIELLENEIESWQE